MYTKESSQETFKIQNNNFDVRFEKAHQDHMKYTHYRLEKRTR